MKTKLVDMWLYLRASYWFIPSLMAISALGTSLVMVQIDTIVGDDWLRDWWWLYGIQPEGARALLATVAGSMITVAGVTFSMTLLAVSHASAQIGPRLLTGFMRDRGNQFTLGTFIATFLYCLMVLRSVQTGVDAQNLTLPTFVPHLAVIVAVALAVLSVMVLIYFFHHVPQSINVSNVVARVGDDLIERIRHIYPEVSEHPVVPEDSAIDLADQFSGEPRSLKTQGDGGYLRVVDAETLFTLAVENDLHIILHRKPGDFAVTGRELMQVWPQNRLNADIEKALFGCFSWGDERTREQDVLYSVEQLLEVLGKALSPGINGQYTAVLCLNQFERALSEVLGRAEPDFIRYDSDGSPRLINAIVSRQSFITEVFAPIRKYARGDWITLRYLIMMINHLYAVTVSREAKKLLTTELEIIVKDIDSGTMAPSEQRSLQVLAIAAKE